ncbi:MAG: protein arginine kinase [Oscillospiraceae bacterium]|nr:protein arginine kinase [Oscillospiraceae bacterium]
MNKDVVISSRIRFARNLTEYPFLSKLDPTSASEIIEKVKNVFPNYSSINFDKLNLLEMKSYVEKHLVSPEFISIKMPKCLILNYDLSIMVCEEDHIRLQCIKSGLSLDEAFAEACEADDMICGKLKIAFDEQRGFLTHCPTNIGTGMRASVMMFLPAMTMNKDISKIAPQLSKFGLTIRGLYGEGTEADGCLYQISNQITLGSNEEETINKLNDIINQIITKERSARDIIKGDKILDIIMRSYGILNYAHIINSKEFLKLYSDIRLGIALEYIKDFTFEEIDSLMINVMPATLTLHSGKQLNENERDIYRTEYIKNFLNKTD